MQMLRCALHDRAIFSHLQREVEQSKEVEPATRLELVTLGLRNRCSTN